MALLPANLHFHVSHPCAAEVYKQTFWMRQWGHETAKRTVLFSNSKWVGGFNLGKMSRAMLESKVKTTTKYKSRDGKTRFKGNSNLKGTQLLGFAMHAFLFAFSKLL